MSAADAVKIARAGGVEVALDGDDLSLKAASEPPAAILDELRRHKTEIIAMLRPGRDRWSAEDWRSYFEERAAVAEFDGGLLRTDAEDQKFECCIVELAESKPGTLIGRYVFDMHNLFRLHDPAETRCRCCRKKGVEAFFQIRRWRAVHSHGSEPIGLTKIQGAAYRHGALLCPSGVTRARCSKLANCLLRFTGGSLKALKRAI
jgi:hypothetical protein